MRKSLDIITAVLLVLFGVLIGIAGWNVMHILSEYKQGQEVYDEIKKNISIYENKGDDIATIVSSEEIEFIKPNFEYLQTINANVKAWLYIPSTNIDYPVVYTNDNNFYLSHLIDGTENNSGSIFIDSDNTENFKDENTIIYGHHMKNGSMFAGLMNYQNDDFYKEHPIAYLFTENEDYIIKFFSAFTAESDSEAYYIRFNSIETYEQWIKKCKSLSDFKCDIDITTDDKVVTLSTCSYSFKDARYLVMGKLSRINN